MINPFANLPGAQAPSLPQAGGPMGALFGGLQAPAPAPVAAPAPAPEIVNVQLADGTVVQVTREQYDAEMARQAQGQTPTCVAAPTSGPQGVATLPAPAPVAAPAVAPIATTIAPSARAKGRGRPARTAAIELLHKCAAAGLCATEAEQYLAILGRVEDE